MDNTPETDCGAGLRTANNDFMHSGTILALADTAQACATVGAYRSELAQDEIPVAVFVSSQIVSNASEGRLVAVATAQRLGRALTAASRRATDENVQLITLGNSNPPFRSTDLNDVNDR